MGRGMLRLDVPLMAFTWNFSSIFLMAPPPFGRLMLGSCDVDGRAVRLRLYPCCGFLDPAAALLPVEGKGMFVLVRLFTMSVPVIRSRQVY